jgi:S-adenosylmethionine:diacylglycerol 3-amino-3-carboxypropyl transferase
MQGRDRGASSARSPGEALPVQRLAVRLAQAIDLYATQPAAAVDTLLLIRLDALEYAPEMARALGDATDALRRGQEAAAVAALSRARRAAGGPIVSRDALSPWAGAGILP